MNCIGCGMLAIDPREHYHKRGEAMTFKEAKKQCRKVGTSRAQGDALRAMYADLIAFKWFAIGNPDKFYSHLQAFVDDGMVTNEARRLLRDDSAALDAMLALV